MSSTQILRGSARVSSDVLVSTDGTSIQGDGSAQNPLRAVGEGAPTLERVTTSGGVATLDPTVDVSYVYAENPANAPYSITLPDGEEDGFEKTVVINFGGVIGPDTWFLLATYETNLGYTSFAFPSGGGGILLCWNADGYGAGGYWMPVSTFLGDPRL